MANPINVTVAPTKIDMNALENTTRFDDFSRLNFGKNLKHNKNSAVVTDSTTNCVNAKSGARKITKKNATE